MFRYVLGIGYYLNAGDPPYRSADVDFNMPQRPISQFRVSPTIVQLRRFAGRYVLPFVVRPFEGAAEQRPLTHGLQQIAGTIRAMGVLPEDSIVRQIGSEFRVLFCAPALLGGLRCSRKRLAALSTP
jgi:hypothetical protein